MINIYKGNEPFIFISYSHKDTDRVLPYIEALSEKGYRVWYDNGIEAGTEWPEYIAERLMSCNTIIAFVSKNAQDSHNCRREINFAIELKKEFLVVYLEDFPLTPGMRLQLGSLQALFSYHDADEKVFYNNLCNASVLAPCLCKPEPTVEATHYTEPVIEAASAPSSNVIDDKQEKNLSEEEKAAARREALMLAVDACNQSLKEHKSSFSFKPASELKEKQITNAIQKHKNIVSKEDVLAVMDDTVFSSGKSGFVITENYFISNQSLFRFIIDLREIVGFFPMGKSEIAVIFTNNKPKNLYFSIYYESFVKFFEVYFSCIKEH